VDEIALVTDNDELHLGLRALSFTARRL
jgi:hypothetical protein